MWWALVVFLTDFDLSNLNGLPSLGVTPRTCLWAGGCCRALSSSTKSGTRGKSCLCRNSDGHGASGMVPLASLLNRTELTAFTATRLRPLVPVLIHEQDSQAFSIPQSLFCWSELFFQGVQRLCLCASLRAVVQPQCSFVEPGHCLPENKKLRKSCLGHGKSYSLENGQVIGSPLMGTPPARTPGPCHARQPRCTVLFAHTCTCSGLCK